MSPVKIVSWLQRQSADVVRFTLFALQLDGRRELLSFTDMQESPGSIAQAACEMAQNHADETEAECNFELASFNSAQVELGNLPMKCRAKGKGYTPPNDLIGAFKVSAQHNEAMARLHVGGMRTAMETICETNRHLREENSELRQENAQLKAELEMLRQGMSAEEAADKAESAAIMGQVVEVFKEHLLPPLAEKLADKVAGANGAAAATGAAA